MSYEKIEVQLGPDKTVTIETGKLAKQAGGSAVVRIGDTMVLVTACVGRKVDADFLPLTVEYREKTYAAGKFPGGYHKRESKPSDRETLTARLIDRPLRPLFPKTWRNEVQIIETIINVDGKNDPATVAVLGASFAVGLSSIPFEKQVASVRVCRIGDEFVVNPTFKEMEGADLDMIVAGSEDSIMMVEGGAYEVSEEVMVEGIMKGHEVIVKLVRAQQELLNKIGVQKSEIPKAVEDEILFSRVEGLCVDKLRETFHIPMTKMPHYQAVDEIKKSVMDALADEYPERTMDIESMFSKVEKREMREMYLNEKIRIDGRKMDEVRPITIETGILPNAHGSALFQRGETQALVVCTLGTKFDEQKMDTLQGDYYKNYYLHYNFPPFSVGETGRIMGPGRREIGHGHLAERSLEPVIPTAESFPYTLRIVSEILESNGSSSMASVCGGSLSLMDTGVPIKSAVSGIAMGLISDGDRIEVLSDITGTEDHLGDMDFKICGTSEGVTGFQMDIKISGIDSQLMLRALQQAKAGRLHILGKMNESLSSPKELSANAPQIMKKTIPSDRIKDLIGPGGKIIRNIQEVSGTTVDVNDSGEITIFGPKRGNAIKAMEMIEEIFRGVEVGELYSGKVKSITNFGIFAEVLPGKEGLIHISELKIKRGERIEDSYKLGDEMKVRCIGVDRQGKVRLSEKQSDE